MKVFVNRVISPSGVEIMKNAGISVDQWTEKREITPDELIQICKNYDGLIIAGRNKIDKTFLNACRHLKVIALHSVGYDHVDVEEATRLKIPIGNTPGVLSAATADVAFFLMMAVARKAFFMHKRILKGEWRFFEPTANLGMDLEGKTLGIFGLGKIGMEVASRCRKTFEMPVIYCNRHPNTEAEEKLGAVRVSFDELLRQSDVLSVHSVLSEETAGLFDRHAFSRMKNSAIFINTARGGIHNEEDLVAALNNKTIWGAGLDVTNPEPMKPDNPLLFMENVAVLPHIGTATLETREKMVSIVAKNIIAGLAGQPIPYAVNPQIYGSEQERVV